MYVTKDRDGNSFKWSRKGKNRECEVIDNKCIVRKCFLPEDCGTVDPKTQQKRVRGMCKGLFDGTCPENLKNTYNERDNKRKKYVRY